MSTLRGQLCACCSCARACTATCCAAARCCAGHHHTAETPQHQSQQRLQRQLRMLHQRCPASLATCKPSCFGASGISFQRMCICSMYAHANGICSSFAFRILGMLRRQWHSRALLRVEVWQLAPACSSLRLSHYVHPVMSE